MAPASHPQAQFVPISPDFDLHALVENTSSFDYVTRLSTEKLKEHSIQSFEALVLAVVIQSGKPLVIEDWGESLPPWLYNPEWIQENLGSKPEQVRDIPNEVNIPMTIGHYLRSMETLTNRITPATYRDPKRQRLYLKDIDTPEAWANHLKEVMPESVFYLNDCIEPRTGGDGAIREPNEYGQMVYGKGVAPAGDLMSSLPPDMRAMNMMCYIGHEGTFTPAHREMCASLGHNIMVEASQNKKGEKPGSSIWFMTETKEREVVSEYFLSMLGHDIEVEKHFAQVNAWKKAPFNVWVVEQKVGDLILIPPLAPHQVWNRGTRTMKAAWNRTTVDTLELALHEALPRARMVCREEQYKNKAIVYYTLLKYHELLQRDTVEEKMWKYGRIKQVLEDFKRLFALYTEILVSEMFSPKLPEETDVEYIEYDSNITCSYCRGNIFNRFLTCKSCIQIGPGGEEDTYDICMDCYAMGRSCACISNLSWVEQWSWSTLVDNYDLWKSTVEKVLQSEGSFDKDRAPKHLEIARKRYGRKPVAEVCQEQLRIRPWTDITKEVQREATPMSEEEPDVDDEGRIKKKKKKKGTLRSAGGRGKFVAVKNKTHTCHICCYHDWNWKLAFCSTCNKAYCYGTLWRAFDLMPQTVMEDKEWSCPCCLKICSCGKCRRDPRQKPYSPKGTLLGHDTKKVADFRSVESLVDFSKTNLAWLRGEDDNDPHQSSRMKKLKEKAEAEKARVEEVDDSYLNGMEHTAFGADNGEGSAQAGNHDIDPFLLGTGESSATNGQYNGHYENGQFDSMDGIANGETNHGTPGANVDWMGNDGHYDFEDFDPSNSQNQDQNQNQIQNQSQASYPSRLLTPTVPKQSYPDPTHVGQDRMMGAGFYKQGTGADRILFDAPDENGVDEQVYQPNPAQNPNFALSDLLDPALQPESTKKRRRMGEDGVEDEEEFFTSKRQKKIATAKKLRRQNGDDTEADLNLQPAHRQPRRSMGKTVYTDLGEDEVPSEDDEGPSTVRNRTNEQRKKKSPKEPLTDMELAAQALDRLSNPSAEAAPVRRRGRPKGTGETSTYSPATNTIKTPRRSAWLARKEAANSDGVSVHDDTPSELPKRTRRPRTSLQTSTAINISSASEDSDDGGVVLDDDDDDDDDDNDNDSLFGEPIERKESTDVVGNDDGIDDAVDKTPSNKEPSVDITDPNPITSGIEIHALGKTGAVSVADFVEAQKPAPKRRGRPPKNPRPVEAESMSPAPPTSAAPVTKLLSLKEKLALKGKGFKIVAKSRESVASSSGPPSVSNTPSLPLKSILKTTTATASPVWNKFDDVDVDEVSASPLVSSSSRPTKPAVSTPAPEVKKAPTVVRLLSPSTEADDASSRSRSKSVSSEDDSGSDTSIPAVRVSANQARRGGRGGTAVRGRGRPRGRPLLGRVV